MSDIVFRRAQCCSTLREEPPEPMIRSRVTLPCRLRRRRCRQRILRHSQTKLGSAAVYRRHSPGLAQIPAATSNGRRGREPGTLPGSRPSQREMQRRCKIRRGQLGQRKTPALSSKPCDGLTRHAEWRCRRYRIRSGRSFFFAGCRSCGSAKSRVVSARISRTTSCMSCLESNSRATI